MNRSLRVLSCVVLVVAAAACRPGAGAAGESCPPRFGCAARGTYFVLDSGFFGLSNGSGAEAALRCELARNLHFESSLGFFGTEGAGVPVDGFDCALSLVALLPVLLPYRPVARAGVGWLTVDPVTVTPTSTFRPSQTAFYLVGGVGVSRAVVGRVHLEAAASFWITPYRYRVYAFDRQEVLVAEERFTHVGISLGAVYSF